jgi:hypothetical protein
MNVSEGPVERVSTLALVRQLPYVAPHPVIADANVLFQDVQRRRKGGFTALSFLADLDAITLLTSDHLRRTLPEKIAAKSTAPRADMRVWERNYLRSTRFVNVPEQMCSGHPQIEAITDPEDRPFARLAIATAPSLLLTRDHHLTDVGFGAAQWGETMTLLGSLIELDVAIYGAAHGAVLLARLLGMLVGALWRALERQPVLALLLGALAGLHLAANPEQTLARLRSAQASLRSGGARLLEASAPTYQARERLLGDLSILLEQPVLPRTIESACVRALAVQRRAACTEDLLSACADAGHGKVNPADLTAFLAGHASFVLAGDSLWQLGELGVPQLDASIALDHRDVIP